MRSLVSYIVFLSLILISCGDESSSVSNIHIEDNEFIPTSSTTTDVSSSETSSSSVQQPGSEIASSSSSILFQESSSSVEYSSSSSVFQFLSETPHGIPYLKISTAEAEPVDTGYVACSIVLSGGESYENFGTESAKIRQRGNSTRIYYDKKPYRIKLGSKAALLGMNSNKDWVLLANYRDPTNFMNALSFDMARKMGNFKFVNSNRFVDVEINGEYVGLYQLTEQIEQAKSRVNIDATEGVLLSLDKDDGPELSPAATNNFFSSVYELPVAVKYPKNPSADVVEKIKSDFEVLEKFIKESNYDSVQKYLDIKSFIDFIILQEITYNVELEAPRSMYLYKENSTGKYTFGPPWDFDGAFAFDWASMTDGHNYFSAQTFLLGTTMNPSKSPANSNDDGGRGGFGEFGPNSYDGRWISGFFVNLFGNAEFLDDYKSRWRELEATILVDAFNQMDGYSAETYDAQVANANRWPIDKDFLTEQQKLKQWLTQRVASYSSVLDNY